MTNLLDTSAIVAGFTDGEIILSVVRELDNLKTREGKTGQQARRTIRKIYENRIPISNDFYTIEMMSANPPVDQILLQYAKDYDRTLVTADLSLYLQAIGRKINVQFIDKTIGNLNRIEATSTYLKPEEYIGVLEGELDYAYPENHFLIFGEEAFRVVDGKPTRVEYKVIDTKEWNGEIKPRNVEQKCLIDLLYSDIPVIAVHSKYGCGKSFLLLNYALNEVRRGNYNKIIVIPNNAAVADSREVGTLPGDILEKELVYLGPLIDLVGVDEIRRMIQQEKIEITPIAFARGRNWENSLVFVSESQNLTDYHIKLLLGRMGEGSRIFFDGDVRQEDSYKLSEKSGLVLLHKLSNSNEAKQFGSIELKSIERSSVARLADVLEKMEEE